MPIPGRRNALGGGFQGGGGGAAGAVSAFGPVGGPALGPVGMGLLCLPAGVEVRDGPCDGGLEPGALGGGGGGELGGGGGGGSVAGGGGALGSAGGGGGFVSDKVEDMGFAGKDFGRGAGDRRRGEVCRGLGDRLERRGLGDRFRRGDGDRLDRRGDGDRLERYGEGDLLDRYRRSGEGDRLDLRSGERIGE